MLTRAIAFVAFLASACGSEAKPSAPPSLGRVTPDLREAAKVTCDGRDLVDIERSENAFVQKVRDRLAKRPKRVLRCPEDVNGLVDLTYDVETNELYAVRVMAADRADGKRWLDALERAGLDAILAESARTKLQFGEPFGATSSGGVRLDVMESVKGRWDVYAIVMR